MKTDIKCTLCPTGCKLGLGEIGDCGVRKNIDHKISCITYDQPAALNVDPIEKKPLYHVLPGTPVLSIGTAGCNLHCMQCQNEPLSQHAKIGTSIYTPQSIADLAKINSIPSVAYTYAEPLVSYEYTLACCKSVARVDLKNILVTAAYINPDPLRHLCTYVDAVNVDLKSFSEKFYQDVCNAHLEPVLTALKIMKEAGIFIEITNLIIPTLNDSEDETQKMCNWILDNLGEETPLHFSRFFPQNKLRHLPATPLKTILRARRIALECGLKFVYTGNMSDGAGESTSCPDCDNVLILRNGYRVIFHNLNNGNCPECGRMIPGIWN
ncbi:AmmeMemoRadiSam system radical SAM enzyme [Pontiellaceae bacterium B1224]|nr:AmmeMemoRadiSam system radical SAM enzyme [Pontiellaceae bacterium B1224]